MNRSISTNAPATSSLPLVSDPAVRRQDGERILVPVERLRGTTRPIDLQLLRTAPDRVDAPQKTFEPPLAPKMPPPDVSANSTPLQVWEGTVVDVDRAAGTMQVLLDAKIGQMPQHTGEIDLEWVDDQDQDLVRPGAVFYLILFKRTKPSVENAQKLRFRRRPAWSASQIEQIERDAAMLRSKMKARPVAE